MRVAHTTMYCHVENEKWETLKDGGIFLCCVVQPPQRPNIERDIQQKNTNTRPNDFVIEDTHPRATMEWMAAHLSHSST
jgi:hypothetical protein